MDRKSRDIRLLSPELFPSEGKTSFLSCATKYDTDLIEGLFEAFNEVKCRFEVGESAESFQPSNPTLRTKDYITEEDPECH